MGRAQVGQDPLARRHRLIGFYSFWLMITHVVLITVGYAQSGGTGSSPRSGTRSPRIPACTRVVVEGPYGGATVTSDGYRQSLQAALDAAHGG